MKVQVLPEPKDDMIPETNDELYYFNYHNFPDIFMITKIKVIDVKKQYKQLVVEYEILEWLYSESVKKGYELFYSGQADFSLSDSNIDDKHYFSSKENCIRFILR